MSEFVRVLYGSNSRGTSDHFSDIDVLAIGDQSRTPPPPPPNNRVSVSSYTWSEFERMHAAGSPFLVHLSLEGRVIGGDEVGRARYAGLMASVPPYQNTLRDLASFDAALRDIGSAIEFQDSTAEFEAAATATVIRHASILGCYLIGSPRFGRHVAVQYFCERRGLSLDMAEDFPKIYAFRLALARGFEWPGGADFEYVRKWLDFAHEVIREVGHANT